MVELGYVAGVFGVKGWLKIFSNTRPRDNILSYSPWYLRVNHQWQTFNLVEGQLHGKAVIVQLKDINDRDQARTLMKAKIAVQREQLPQAIPGEYYWHDLEGLKVVNTSGFEFGRITGFIETGANDVMIICAEPQHKPDDEKSGNKELREYLIPYLWQDVVLEVDIRQGQLKVDWDPDYL